MLKKKFKRIIQIELNEISFPVIETLVAQNKLPNFRRINKKWQYLQTTSEIEYDKLEPWIQWVTAHTGKTFEEHQIFRLSDVDQLKYPQIWEVLSQNKIESGIIGSMNTARRATEGGIFFSDPWAKANDTFPDNLKPLWDLVSSKVQGHSSTKLSINDLVKGLKACLTMNLPISIYIEIVNQLVQQKINPLNKWRLAGVFDLFLAEIFKRILNTTNFGYYTLFLNSVAHYQHHYWRNFDKNGFDPSINYTDIAKDHDPITFGYKLYDKILGQIIDIAEKDSETLVIILSGLSQIPYTKKEKTGGVNYYRLKNHKDFSQKIDLIDGFEIFPLMSRDWQLKYDSQKNRQKALKVLSSLTIKNKPLFKIKEHIEGYIFIETQFDESVHAEDYIQDLTGTPLFLFEEIFKNIAIKSGHHSGIGSLWASSPIFESTNSTIPLTQVYTVSLGALGVKLNQNCFLQVDKQKKEIV